MVEAVTKTPNYTDEMTATVIEQYSSGVDLDAIAESVGKTVRSVRSKLVREGVYVAQPKQTAAKREGPTKKELLRELEGVIGTDIEVSNFMGATKNGIQYLVNTFRS